MTSTEMRRSLAGFALLAGFGLFTVIPVSASEKTTGPHDPGIRRIVAEFEAAAAAVSRQFRADLARALAKCGKECEPAAFAQTLADRASLAERKLTVALRAADKQLKERASALKDPDGVLGAAGDLSRGVASLEAASQRVSAEMTESLSVLKGAGFGGQPLLTTLQLRVASLVYITPISLVEILTVHVGGSPTAYVYIEGGAPADSTVTVTFTCGGSHQTLHTKTNDQGYWSVSTNVTLSGSKTCSLTATAGAGIHAGSFTTEINF